VKPEKYLLIPFIILPTLFLGIVTIYPLAYSVILSLYSRGDFVGLKNYANMLHDDRFLGAMFVTLSFTTLTVAATVILGLVLAAVLVFFSVKGKSWWQTAFVVPLAIPPVVSGLIWKILYHPSFGPLSILRLMGLPIPDPLSNVNLAIFAVSVINIWMWTPFAFLVFYAGIGTVSRETLEAALIDGASKIQVFRRIILPSIRTLIMVVVFWRFTANLTVFDVVMGSTEGGPGFSTTTLTMFSYDLAFKSFDLSYATTAAVYLLLLVAVIGFSLFNRLGIIRE
jgi:multiple sugar transport system permease protein